MVARRRVALLGALMSALVLGASAQLNSAAEKSAQVSLTYLGTAGWQISDGTTVILIDPYLSRIFGPQPPGRAPFP